MASSHVPDSHVSQVLDKIYISHMLEHISELLTPASEILQQPLDFDFDVETLYTCWENRVKRHQKSVM